MALEYYTGKTQQEIIDILNEKTPEEAIWEINTNNIITFKGKLWNANNVASATTIYSTAASCQNLGIWIDEDAHLLLIQLSNVSGIYSANEQLANNLGHVIYMENLNNECIFFINTTPINPSTAIPFCAQNCYATAYISNFTNLQAAYSTLFNSYNIDTDDFELSPMYVGFSKIKNMYVCHNNRCLLGRIINVDGEKYKCVGRQMFYKL